MNILQRGLDYYYSGSRQGRLYFFCNLYVFFAITIIIYIGFYKNKMPEIKFHTFVDAMTIIMMIWLINKSFSLISQLKHVEQFRLSIFILLNSTLVTFAGALHVFDKDTASFVSSLIFFPGIAFSVYSFVSFIRYANEMNNLFYIQSMTDDLTGLPNRRCLDIQLENITDYDCVICIADIDFFKKINDGFGHHVGDKVLIKLGDIFSKISSDDIFIARSGGEEFTLILKGIEDAELRINKIRRETCFFLEGKSKITLSFGAALKKKDELYRNSILKADKALYDAKRSGRDCLVMIDD